MQVSRSKHRASSPSRPPGTKAPCPAGSLTSTFKVGFDSQSLDSENLRFSEEQQASVFSERSLSRDRTSASGNFNLPIASRDREVLGERNLMCARNEELCALGEPLLAGDEVAFFPTVTGG